MKCPECKKEFGYMRIKSRQWVCRNCGLMTEIKDFKKIIKNIAGI